MLNQPKGMNPIGYLRNSARLLRRQWDDGLVEGMVIGNVDLTAAGYVIATGTLIVAALAGLASHQQMVTLWGGAARVCDAVPIRRRPVQSCLASAGSSRTHLITGRVDFRRGNMHTVRYTRSVQ
jgi:hypothetical protein